MKNLQRVVWSKGMFLTPQHFQAQEDYFEDALQFRFTASNFANYGVNDLGIDEEGLVNGQVALRRCRGVLPDGLIFNAPETDALPQVRPIEEFFQPSQETMDVYLAIPETRPRSKNVTQAAGAQTSQNGALPATRYLAETRMIPDANAGADEKAVQFAGKTLRLLFEGENLDGLTTMRIARIARNQAGAYALSPKFVPPCLNIAASEYLMMLIRRQVEVLTAKAGSLSLPRREKGRGLADFSTSEIANFWLLHTVNSYAPELNHIWNARRGHPEPLFVAMLRLAGALSTFVIEETPRDLPIYDHDDLGLCFSQLDDRIRGFLKTVIKDNFVPIPLLLTDKLVWSGTVPEDHYFKNSQFFLSVSAPLGVDELINKFPRLAKISSPAEIDHLVKKSVTGIKLRHVPVPPAAIPLKLSNQYFSLEQTGPLWEGVRQSRNINIFVPSEISDPKMELLIVLE